MRAAIVCDSFVAGLGYQENAWARTLSSLGWTVRTIGALEGPAETLEIEHVALPTRTRLRHCVPLASENWPALPKFELVLAFGNRAFASNVVENLATSSTKVVSFFQEHSSTEAGWRGSVRSALRPFWYRLVLRGQVEQLLDQSNEVVVNTPDTIAFMRRCGVRSGALDTGRLLPLGVAPGTFAYDGEQGGRVRMDLGVGDGEPLVIATGRYNDRKTSLVALLQAEFGRLLRARPEVHVLVVGLPLDNGMDPRLHVVPSVDQARLNNYYSAADLAIFLQPSIGIQQAMATGLPVVTNLDPAVAHLGQYGDLRRVAPDGYHCELAAAKREFGEARRARTLGSFLDYRYQVEVLGIESCDKWA